MWMLVKDSSRIHWTFSCNWMPGENELQEVFWTRDGALFQQHHVKFDSTNSLRIPSRIKLKDYIILGLVKWEFRLLLYFNLLQNEMLLRRSPPPTAPFHNYHNIYNHKIKLYQVAGTWTHHSNMSTRGFFNKCRTLTDMPRTYCELCCKDFYMPYNIFISNKYGIWNRKCLKKILGLMELVLSWLCCLWKIKNLGNSFRR